MTKMLIRSAVAVIACLAGNVFALAPPSASTLATYSNAAIIVSRRMPETHLQKEAVNDSLAAKALDIFLDSLDYEHTFFLRSDIERFKAESNSLDEALKSGDLDFAFEIYDTFMNRISNRVDYVDRLLETGFDLDEDEQYEWKRKDLPWPADKAEWNELWRKKIKNLYLGHVISDMLDEEESLRAEGSESGPDGDAESDAQDGEEAVLSADETPEESIRNQYKQLLSVMNDNDAHWLLTQYITSFARAMDPHSDFMSQRDIEDFNISMKKSLIGIGALLNTKDGAAEIVRLIPGGPAEIDGRLQPNDRIIAVAQGDGEPVDIRHWPLSRSVRLIRGEKGSKVVLSVIPASDISGTKVKKIELVRDEVKLEEQVAKGEVRDLERTDGHKYRVGVLTIPDFYADMESQNNGDLEARSVTKDVRRILEEFKSTNRIDGLVVDLRNNGGGSLSEAVDLTGLFIDSGPVVQVKTQAWMAKKLYDADPEQLYKGPLVVLVNRLSASASEIFAGALQDYRRAVIVGDSKTHGKGTVQALLPLSRSNQALGSLKLTTAGFYRIEGSSTQMKGVEPDIIIPSILDYMEVGEEHQPHALQLSDIRPAFYWASKDLDKYLPKLKLSSRADRRESERYQEYMKLLEHIGERRSSSYISLKLDERIETARAERKMQDIALKMDVDATVARLTDDEDEQEEFNDLVLEMTLNVVGDLIDLQDDTKNEIKQSIAVNQ